MKKTPEDFPYYVIPSGISWSKRNGWVVRRTDKKQNVEKYFWDFEAALDFCNKLFADKRPPFTLEMLQNENTTKMFPPVERQTTLDEINQSLASLVDMVIDLQRQLELNNDYIRTSIVNSQQAKGF